MRCSPSTTVASVSYNVVQWTEQGQHFENCLNWGLSPESSKLDFWHIPLLVCQKPDCCGDLLEGGLASVEISLLFSSFATSFTSHSDDC